LKTGDLKTKFMTYRTSKIQFYLLGLFSIATIVATAYFFEWGMAGLSAFLLAYSTKGIRRTRFHHNTSKQANN
jgi:hypothetical protein